MKSLKLAYGIDIILFILFNIIVFSLPINHTDTFWIAYTFTNIAILGQLYIWTITFDTDLKKVFFRLPLTYVSSIYLITQLIAFSVLISIQDLPTWITTIVCFVIFGVTLICTLSAEIAKEEIEKIDEKVKIKTFFIKSLQVDVEVMVKEEKDEEVIKALNKLAEDIRYSDPVSNDSLSEIDTKIKAYFNTLKSSDDKLTIIQNIENLLFERNKKSKLLK